MLAAGDQVQEEPELLAARASRSIDTVYYPAFTVERPGEPAARERQGPVGQPVHPEHQHVLPAKSPDNHYWFPPVVNVSIFINLKDPILKNLAVRQAMAYAIDRPKVSEIGEYGYEPPSNQTGIVTPTFKSWLDQGLAKQINYNPKKAKQILAAGRLQVKSTASSRRRTASRSRSR